MKKQNPQNPQKSEQQQPLKVLHLISSRGLYGAERIILNLIGSTDRTRFIPSLALLQVEGYPNMELIEAVQAKGAQGHVITCRKWVDLEAVGQTRELIRRENIALVHCHEMKGRLYGLLAAMGTPARLITTNHNWIRSDVLVTCFESLDAFYIRFFPKIVAVSPEVRQLMRRYLTPAKKMQVIINGIDMQEFRKDQQAREKIRREFHIAPETQLIGAFGRISPEKGQKYFLAAAAQVLKVFPEARFLIVGDGFQGEEMREYTVALGISKAVIFAGFRSDVAALYSALDIFVLPSLLEGTPMALLEAMATELPVIASDVGGVGRIIRHGENGLLVPSADANALAAEIRKLLTDDMTKATQLAKNAVLTVEARYSARKMSEDYMVIYDQLLSWS
ncbi:MAG: glycosyltransferase [Candidatus Electrothrix sp. ATG1]|nr:glycosyltransferase [Candidatus Electrothrix sp. ATG1]